MASLGQGGVVRGMQIATVSRWGAPQSQFVLGPTVFSTRPLCSHSQETSSTNGIISIAMLFKQKKMSLFIRWKAIFREWKKKSQLIGVLRYFSCCQLPCGFDVSVFTGLQLVSGALCLKVMYLSVFWPHSWFNECKVQVSYSGRVSTMEHNTDFALTSTISSCCYRTCFSENDWCCRTFFLKLFQPFDPGNQDIFSRIKLH